ncbi:MAG: peptidylprolyl isomerase [Candidatus Aenigmarchaeota archaeon]|nr:peptidylprolyl isomerase [Candidatus Aenigmarchaeota archaeon]
MKNGDFAEIEYIGKIKQSGDIFDLTDEKIAKEKGIFNSGTIYGPITIIVGAKQVLVGLDSAILSMNANDKKTINIEAKDAFGDRNPKLIKLIPLAQFKKQNLDPKQGQYITFDQGLRGKILSVAGGRIKIDFNHPLAGKELEYELKLNKIITDNAKKVKSLISFYFGSAAKNIKTDVKETKVIIDIPKKTPINDVMKKKIEDDFKKYIPAIKTVEFKIA